MLLRPGLSSSKSSIVPLSFSLPSLGSDWITVVSTPQRLLSLSGALLTRSLINPLLLSELVVCMWWLVDVTPLFPSLLSMAFIVVYNCDTWEATDRNGRIYMLAKKLQLPNANTSGNLGNKPLGYSSEFFIVHFSFGFTSLLRLGY